MPYKEKQKNPVANPRKLPSYKVINWTEYNNSLRKRGALSLYFPRGDLKSQFINDLPYVEGISGQYPTYQTSYIELMYTLYRLFSWGIRQICGYFEDLWKSKGLDIKVPSFGHLSDLFEKIPVKTKQFCDKLARRLEKGEAVSLIADSTGLKFRNSREWFEEKYGRASKNKPWAKMHLSMDEDFNIHAVEITDHITSDIEMTDKLIPDPTCVDKFIADGAYYSIDGTEELIPVIPPPSNAVIRNKSTATWHDYIVQYIKNKGTVYAFHKKYGYGARSLVEAQISRIKRCIGTSLQTQKDESRKREGIVIGNIINLWNSFGRCVSVKTV